MSASGRVPSKFDSMSDHVLIGGSAWMTAKGSSPQGYGQNGASQFYCNFSIRRRAKEFFLVWRPEADLVKQDWESQALWRRHRTLMRRAIDPAGNFIVRGGSHHDHPPHASTSSFGGGRSESCRKSGLL